MQILVFGMHRSGTSMVARILNMMGAYFAPEGVSNGANIENPKGFWERRDVRSLNDMLLSSAGANWRRLSGFSISRIPEENLARFKTEAGSLVLNMDAHRPWFLKEPRLSVLAPLWLELLEFPVCVFVHRSPLEVARSLQTRNGFPIPFGLALWERYLTAALDATRDVPRVVVYHRDLFADPYEVVRRLARRMEELGTAGLRIPSEAEILSFIDPSLYRAKESAIKGTLTKAQKDLQKAIETGEAFLSKKPLSFSARSRAILARHEEGEEVRERVISLEERNRLLLDEMATVRAAADRQLKIAKTETAKNAGIATPLVKAFQREMAVLRQELKGGADDVRLLRREQEIVKLRQALVEARVRIQRDKGEAASAREQIVGLRQALVEARARIERDKGEAATAGKEITKLSERLIVFENEIEELRSQGKSSARRILDLNHALARRQSLLVSEQAQSEEVRSKNKILKRGLSDLEGLFKQLRDSRSFHFIAYTARRLGLVSRTPRQTTEAIKNQFSAIRKALKEVKSATSPEAAARKGGAGRTAPPPPSRAETSAPGRFLRKDDPALRAEVDRATALRTAASGKHALRMPTTVTFPEPSVCLVVLHHAGAHHLENLFSSFQKTNTYSNVEFNVVLHACTDRSREIIRTYQSRLRIRVTECTDNLSFSSSNNRAVERTAAEYVIFLNNDIVFQEDVLTKVLQALQDARTGFVGLRLLYPRDNPDHPGGLQHAGIKFRPDPYFFFQRPFNLGASEFVADTPKVLERFPAVTGAFLACRRADFLRAGGFCQDYLYGYEDVDIALCFARLLGLRTVAANQVSCLHQESATGRFDQPELIDARRLKNIGHLVRRHGWYLRRKILADKMAGKFLFSENHLEVAFAVTEANSDTKAGDFFSASELAEACREEFGWNIRYLCRNADWYDLSGVDVLVVLLDAYELSQIREAKPDLVKIAWMRNWFERWASRSSFDQYDLFFCSSASSAHWLAEHHRKPGWVFPLATNRERFAAGQPEERWKSDYCFTGSYWQFEREIASLLQPERLEPFQFALFGGGWETHPTLQIYARGFVPYVHLPDVYASTRVVIDDANHVTKEWGSLNSRVFDALASGALVITNNQAGAAEVFDGELPVYRSAGELEALLRYYLEKDAERSELVDRLRQKVIAHHTYRQRARALKCVLINRARRSYRIALKIAAPDRDQIHQWGDYHFARSLGKAFAALGHSFRIDCHNEWDRPEAFGDDVVIVLRGLSRYRPKPGQVNLMWNISHPDKVQDEEYEEFNHVFVAARLHAAYLSERLQTPVSPLLQCTDPTVFYPDPNPDLPAESLLFVGNSRKQDREAVRFAVRADLPLGIYGSAWSALVPPEFIRGEYIENATLRQHYSQCDILLNDHWPSMRERGFISNRLFDAAAAGAFVITDPVEEAAAVFGEDLTIYRNEKEFRGLIEYYLAHPE
ncbi:MAG: glycosyltransferase, partial [Chthoniobacterales bacterium]|nr:glycosyltransferase [Chthoniobacterales bacterium]